MPPVPPAPLLVGTVALGLALAACGATHRVVPAPAVAISAPPVPGAGTTGSATPPVPVPPASTAPIPTVPTAPPTPVVGQCWTTLTDAVFLAPSNPSPSVDCASTHQLETLAVVPLTGAVAAADTPPADATSFGRAAGKTCAGVVARVAGTGGAASIWDSSVMPVPSVPTVADWTAGARWARCDAAVLAFAQVSGLAQSARRFAIRRGALAGADPASPRLRLCATRGKGSADPVRYVESCDHSHNAEYTHDFALGPVAAAYPGQQALTTRLEQLCRARLTDHATVAFTSLGAYISGPDQTAWEAGNHTGQCLLNVKDKTRGTSLK